MLSENKYTSLLTTEVIDWVIRFPALIIYLLLFLESQVCVCYVFTVYFE